MKTKVRLFVIVCLITAAAITSFNVAQIAQSMDVSLAGLALIARADDEGGCCTARDACDHCGMKIGSDSGGICCNSSTDPCDLCRLCDYRECDS